MEFSKKDGTVNAFFNIEESNLMRAVYTEKIFFQVLSFNPKSISASDAEMAASRGEITAHAPVIDKILNDLREFQDRTAETLSHLAIRQSIAPYSRDIAVRFLLEKKVGELWADMSGKAAALEAEQYIADH
jgi:hypothetical protein